MHCPNCGTKIYTVQKFCRACGLSLEPFAQLLAIQSQIPMSVTEQTTARLQEKVEPRHLDE